MTTNSRSQMESRSRMVGALLTLAAVLAPVAIEPVAASSIAYIGPGAGLSAIGAFLALVAGLAVAVFGFLWYPIKRMIRFMGGGKPRDAEEEG